jgi:hypothetical protein
MAVPRNLRFTFGWSESDLTDMWFRVKRVDELQEKMRNDQLYTESMDQKFAADFSRLKQQLQRAETELGHLHRAQLKLGAAEDQMPGVVERLGRYHMRQCVMDRELDRAFKELEQKVAKSEEGKQAPRQTTIEQAFSKVANFLQLSLNSV